MRLLILLSAILLTSNAFAEKWVHVSSSDIGETYADIDSAQRTGNAVRIREKVELKSPQKTIFSSPPYEYVSFISQLEYDCTEKTVATLDRANITADGSKKAPDSKIVGVRPLFGSFMEQRYSFACSKALAPTTHSTGPARKAAQVR